MGLFGGDEFVDYTLLKRKGILKVDEIKSDLIDFTAVDKNNVNASESAGSSPPAFGSFFDASQNQNSLPVNENKAFNPFGALDSVGALPSADNLSGIDDKSMNALKIKLDDFEFKVEKILERLEKIEGRLLNLN